MKNLFIIVDTWNGEGYSDSSYEIIEANNINEVHDYCIGKAQQCISIDDGEITETINKGERSGSVSYQIDDDYGCIHWEYLSEDAIAVAINPMVNEYWMIESQADLQEMMNIIIANSDEDFEEEAIIGGYHHNGLGDGDLTIQMIDLNEEDISDEGNHGIYNGEGIVFYDSGDGVEYEVWQDEKTDKLYRVPIEIVRDFALMEEVSSCHEAKFGS